MGKKQHSKDRMFITKTEGATEWRGAKSKEFGTPFKRLPFYCCALTFTQFEVPVCTSDGSVFDIMHIMPYINKYGRHPVTGAPLKKDDLIPLTFHKNQEGEYHCPVLNKVFTEFTHIVAVKTTGNVFCYEAIKEFNIETKNWKDLLTDEPFSREDIITIHNPNALDTKVLVDFDHVKKNLKIDDEESKKMESDPSYNINVIGDIKQMLKELGTEKAKEIALQSLASDSRRRRKSGWPPHNVSMGGGRSSCSSSGEEDGDAEWMAAINSVTSSATHASNGASRQDKDGKHKPKHYQIKVGRLLEDILDKTIEVVSERVLIVEEDPPAEDAGVRLFRSAPRGIVFDQREELHGPKKKPKIVPGEDLHEKSKKFRKQLQSVAVDGADIIVAASRECQKSLAKVEARESAAKTAAKREEERVAELKRVRGERWLPCIAREMRVNAQSRR